MKKHLALVLVAYASFAVSSAFAQTVPDWEKKWADIVAGAKKEGKVVIIAPPDPQVREALPAAFKKKYGVTVEYIGGRSRENPAKKRAEHAAGVHNLHAAPSGPPTQAGGLSPAKEGDPHPATPL